MIDDSGPAFPTKDPVSGATITGMTLRQWLATHAPKGEAEWTIGECEQKLGLEKGGYNFEIHWPIMDARWRYAWADAMIAEGKNLGGVIELLGKLKKSLHQMTFLAKQEIGKFPSDFLRQQLIEAREVLEQVGKVAK